MTARIALLSAFALLLSAAAPGQDIIIESRPEGKNNEKYREISGKWISSNTPADTAKSSAAGLTPQGQAGSRKFLLPGVSSGNRSEIQAAARFTPDVPTAGKYHVYVTFPMAGNASPTLYAINHAGGEAIKPVVQDGFGGGGLTNGNLWIDLGEFEFEPGDKHFVELRVPGDAKAADTRTMGQAYADAVRVTKDPVAGAADGSSYETAISSDIAPLTSGAGAPPPAANQPAAPAMPPLQAANQLQTDPGAVKWLEDIDAARQQAESQNRKIFVFFYTPGSERSESYEKQVLSDAAVRRVLNDKYIPVRLNLDATGNLAASMKAFRAGTINLYDSKGGSGQQITDTPEASSLAQQLRSY